MNDVYSIEDARNTKENRCEQLNVEANMCMSYLLRNLEFDCVHLDALAVVLEFVGLRSITDVSFNGKFGLV